MLSKILDHSMPFFPYQEPVTELSDVPTEPGESPTKALFSELYVVNGLNFINRLNPH